MRRAPLLAMCVAIAGCGGGAATVKPNAAASYVQQVVFQQTGFRAVDLSCPSGVAATAGRTFRCHFTGPEGPYTAYLKIVKVAGSEVAFKLKTQPSNWPPPTL